MCDSTDVRKKSSLKIFQGLNKQPPFFSVYFYEYYLDWFYWQLHLSILLGSLSILLFLETSFI